MKKKYPDCLEPDHGSVLGVALIKLHKMAKESPTTEMKAGATIFVRELLALGVAYETKSARVCVAIEHRVTLLVNAIMEASTDEGI